MKSLLALGVAALLCVGVTVTEATQAERSPGITEKTARIALVREFIREMEVLYRLQETAKEELAENSSTVGRLTTGIRVGSRTLFEMRENASRLDRIGLDIRWGEFRDLLKSFHSQRMAGVEEMTQMSKAMLSGPAPGVNYGAMTARAPELTAQVEQIDKTMFTMSQPLFLALVDEGRVEADGKLHHLILNKKDRADIIHTIDIAFGQSLDDKNATSIVNAAWAIKYGLTRPNYKAADEP
ncbi:hypothetical protein [Bradyrhizobium sp. Arg816]|uniref:hypothetical protein n=1 Tax=Bradyrhizobium sp. Arg816 TaxID=2998491 RepID=UPI00249F7E96|nr:hypothetical protein [Bradyrhizobium sp. Arg816]MDI3564209.1 hypothetical protein [Bradyrhizobium sp. Arg816]